MQLFIDANSGETKLQQLINELLRIINTQLTEGDILPSVNTLSKELKLSRDTVFKAYTELKRRKVVASTPTKGYYVSRELNKVLLLLDYYSPFKDIVYREIEKNLDNSWSIDLVFHHYNKSLFDTVILESIGRYNAYIVMNFDTQTFNISDSLKKIEPDKLLLLDIPIENWKDFDKKKYNYLWQNFEESVYQSLNELYTKLSKYKVINLLYPSRLQHPITTITACEKFCADKNIKFQLIKSTENLEVNQHEAYFILRQSDLYTLLTSSQKKNLNLGKDIGILAYNDIPLYEFVSCGITVISTDFKSMGEKASHFIAKQAPVHQIIPTKTIIRESL